MMHLVLCFSVWTLVFTYLFWRFMAIAKQAIGHLKRLHQIPCNKCAYFTGDYRLKCTVNPIDATSENAIGCRDFLYDPHPTSCNGCSATNKCSNTRKKQKYSLFKRKLTDLK